MRRVHILVGVLPMLLAAVVCANDYVVTQPLVISPNSVMTVQATDHYIFSNTGKIVVSANATLRFAGRDARSNPTDVSLFTLGGTMPSNWPIIDVQSGGIVTGKQARFVGLPVALSSNNGKISLDSVNFVNCDNSVYISMFSDTVAFTNSTISGGRIGLSALANSTSNHYFLMRNCIIELCTETGIELYKVRYGLIDHCKGQGVNTAIGIFLQSVVGLDILYYSGWDWGGNIEWLDSSPHLGYDSLAHNGSFAICASGDAAAAPFARIDHCYIGHNGWNGGVGGFVGYACSPVFFCNSFDRNVPYQVYATGNAAPSFYDAKNGRVGANYFVGVAGYPLVYMKDAYPYFLDGQNEFHLDDPNTSLYMQDDSQSPKTHFLSKNYFANGADIRYFYPGNASLWSIPGQSGPGSCGASLGSYVYDNGGKVLMGDAFLAAGMTTPAQTKYNQTLNQSGEGSDAGAVALQRLSQISTNVPAVNSSSLQLAKKYLLSYKYDASGNFDAADSIRLIILANASANDSMRVAYDKSVALALQATTNKAANTNAFTQHDAVVARRALFNRIITKGTTPTPLAMPVLPATFTLLPVYPNPFNATTQIRFDVPNTAHLKVAVYGTDGRLVRMLSDANYSAGSYRLEWNGKDNSGMTVASGVYLVKLQSPNGIATKKAVLLK